MIFLPEASDFIADDKDHALKLTNAESAHFTKSIQNHAKECNIWVSLGIHEEVCF